MPVIVGNSGQTVMLSERLMQRGFNVVPAVFPGVAENQARLRFFITSEHSQDQIDQVIDTVAEELPDIRRNASIVGAIVGR